MSLTSQSQVLMFFLQIESLIVRVLSFVLVLLDAIRMLFLIFLDHFKLSQRGLDWDVLRGLIKRLLLFLYHHMKRWLSASDVAPIELGRLDEGRLAAPIQSCHTCEPSLWVLDFIWRSSIVLVLSHYYDLLIYDLGWGSGFGVAGREDLLWLCFDSFRSWMLLVSERLFLHSRLSDSQLVLLIC